MITVQRTFIRTLTLSPQVRSTALSASTSVSGKTKATKEPKKAGKATAKKVVKTDDLKSKNKTLILDIVEEKSTAIKTSSKELKSEPNTVLSKPVATLHGRPLTSFTVIDLKKECADRGLTKSGKKQNLVERLEQYILEHEIANIDKFATGAVKTDDLESKSKTPILDIVEEKLTAIKTSSKELKSPKVAIKIEPENASTEIETTKTATSQAIKTKTSAAKNVEKKTEETIVSEKPQTDAPNKTENFPFSSIKIEEDAKKVANEEKKRAKADAEMKAKKRFRS